MPSLSVKSAVGALFPAITMANGLRRGILHPFYMAHPESCPSRGIRGWLQEMQWPSDFTFLDDYPSEGSPGWTNNIQGVTHDHDHWYFSQADENIWKIPVSRDLGSEVPDGELHGVSIPLALRAAGYDHFGDLDYFDGRLYVALEANAAEVPQPPRVCVFDADSLAFAGSAVLTGQANAPWCAIHPVTGDLYSSAFDTAELQVYRRSLIGNSQGRISGLEVTHLGGFNLHSGDGSALDLARVQGGAFSRSGHLYLVVDTDARGVVAIDMICGRRVFEYPKASLPAGAEMEGITVWDLDDGRAPHISGQVHVVWLDDDVGSDDIYLSHFQVPHGERARV